MKQLILKDVRSFGVYNILGLLLSLVVGYFAPSFENPIASNFIYALPIFITAFVFIIILTDKDSISSSESIFISMPVTKFDIVKSRYLTILLYMVVTSALLVLSSNISVALFDHINGRTLSFIPIIFIFGIFIVFLSLFLPMQFHSSKMAQRYNLFFILFLGFFPRLLESLGIVELSQDTIQKIFNANYKVISPILLLISLFFYTISLFIAKGIYEKREF